MNKFKKGFLVIILLCFTALAAYFFFPSAFEFGGLVPKPPAPVQNEQPKTEDTPKKNLVRSFEYVNETTKRQEFSVYFAVPDIKNAPEAVKTYYDNVFNEYKAREAELKASLDDYKTNGGAVFVPYIFNADVKVMLNDDKYISVSRHIFENTGGASSFEAQKSETFDKKTGEKLSLNTILNGDKTTLIKTKIIEQIAAKKGSGDFAYFENYDKNVKELFNPESFYLTEKGIVFYFQPFELASGGYSVQFFELTYEELK